MCSTFDYATLPVEIWCDMLEDEGVSTEELRVLVETYVGFGYDDNDIENERGSGITIRSWANGIGYEYQRDCVVGFGDGESYGYSASPDRGRGTGLEYREANGEAHGYGEHAF